MERQFPRIALALMAGAALVASPLAAHAHRAWLAPNATNFSGDDAWVAVDAAISNDLFYADHNPMNLDTVSAIGPDGEKLKVENGQRGHYRSTFDVHLTQPGTTRIFVLNNGVGGTYVVDGQAYRIAPARPGGALSGMAPMGPPPAPASGPPRPLPGVSDPAQIPAAATDIKLVQTTSRNETFASRGAPTPVKPTGEGLELSDASVHPNDLVADEPATFALLLDGEPAAGVAVTVVAANQRFNAPVADIKLTTDAKGAFTVKWPTPGFYWLNAVVEGLPSTLPNATRRAAYTATLEVQKP